MTYAARRSATLLLAERLRSAHDGWGTGPVFDADPALLGQLVSRMALAQGEREVRYLSVDVAEASVRVILFLDDAVIDASFKEGALVVDVLPLDIRSMRVTATEDSYEDSRVDPEQPVAVNVTLVEGRTLTLRGTGRDDDELTIYLPTLFGKTTAR